ncbi:methylenetetrahydrofolate reductase [NAD(P)H] [Rhodoligotrophos defluvii]|uniref:methylenetetrahydrofolate reductase [NAD(P)H] n=1 Tax=Rhodoligotrophos defluvii TaxID=2561934 RepID=UPI0010C9BC3B|nr:methylenetetrahydrofolate reductase [NAD(P)H] [Rhodoligotrophos defluvii]
MQHHPSSSETPAAQHAIDLSFELFPARTPEAETALHETVDQLSRLKPRFMSVTYGAGGTTQDRTLGMLQHLVNAKVPAAGHLTCVGAPRSAVNEMVGRYLQAGVRHIVALRGDPQGGLDQPFVPHPEGYANAAALVKGIRAITEIEISVAAYPEKHPQSPDIATDLDMLRAKVDNGANRAITQFFFDNDLFYRYLDRVRARGITVPVVPGIMPIVSFARIRSFAEKCGATVPTRLADRFSGCDNDPERHMAVAAEVAAEQVTALREQGVRQFHFYTLNRADLVFAICALLGIEGAAAKRCAA